MQYPFSVTFIECIPLTYGVFYFVHSYENVYPLVLFLPLSYDFLKMLTLKK